MCEAMKISAKDGFEVAFNSACALLAARQMERARSELEHAQRLGTRPDAQRLPPHCLRALHGTPPATHDGAGGAIAGALSDSGSCDVPYQGARRCWRRT